MDDTMTDQGCVRLWRAKLSQHLQDLTGTDEKLKREAKRVLKDKSFIDFICDIDDTIDKKALQVQVQYLVGQ